jgi:hypothetical protein
LPDVRFNYANLENYPIQMLVIAEIYLGDKYLGTPENNKSGYYSGRKILNMNPGDPPMNGHFSVQEEAVSSSEQLKIIIKASVFREGVEYKKLPKEWGYNRAHNTWVPDP